MMQRFSTARDVLFYGVVLPIFACCVVLAVFFASERAYIPFIGLLIVDLFILWASLWTYYEFTVDFLTIVSGPFRWKIKYQDIEAIIHTRDATAAPALARNRLAIMLKNGGRVLISPADELGFLTELKERNGNIDFSRVSSRRSW